jgi:hypothetical protein
MTTAVVAQTKERAKLLARDLGIASNRVFGARCAASFDGLRVGLVLIDADAQIPADFMDTIRANVAKSPGGGRIRYVSVRSERAAGT